MINPEDHEMDYDPFVNRRKSESISNWEACCLLIFCGFSANVFSLYQSFRIVGWFPASIISILAPGLYMYSVHSLIQSQHILCKRQKVPYMTYQETALCALENGPVLLRVLKPIFSNCDACLIFFACVSTAGEVSYMGGKFSFIMDSFLDLDLSQETWTIALYVPIFVLSTTCNLHVMARIAFLGILVFLAGLILLFYEVGTKENADYYVHGMEETVRLEDIMDAMWIHFYSIYILMETVTFEQHMSKPNDMMGICGLLNLTTWFVTTVNYFTGFFGYMSHAYWHMLNTRSLRGDQINDRLKSMSSSMKLAWSMIVFAGAVTSPVDAFLSFNLIWLHLQPKLEEFTEVISFKKGTHFGTIIFIGLTTLIFTNLTLFNLFVSLVYVPVLGIAIPMLVHLCVFFPYGYGHLYWRAVLDMSVMLCGLFVMSVYAYIRLSENLFEAYKH